MGLRYGLLAALTLVLASAILFEHFNPPREVRLDRREEVPEENRARIVVGGDPLSVPPEPSPEPGIGTVVGRSPGPAGAPPSVPPLAPAPDARSTPAPRASRRVAPSGHAEQVAASGRRAPRTVTSTPTPTIA